MDVISGRIVGLGTISALAQIRFCQSTLVALETAVIAKANATPGGERVARRGLNDGKTSRSTIAKKKRRAEVAAKNSALVDKVAEGELSPEQLDVIAETSAKTDGAAAVDEEFIGAVAGVDPDQAKVIADKFVADHADPDKVQSEHDRQRAMRAARKNKAGLHGLDTIRLEGDAVSVAEMWAAIVARSSQLYETDGGRDLDLGKHPRTHDQRMFDAAHQLICGAPGSALATTTARPQVVIGVSLDHLVGNDPAGLAEQVGLGPIPDSVLARYLGHGDILAALYDQTGQPLWLGRARRHASLIQRYALILRDKGCVLCSAEHQRCDAHHLTPWNAPAKGTTDLDQLVLLCPRCHHQLHGENQTLYRDLRRRWRARPATATETPPTPINHPKRK